MSFGPHPFSLRQLQYAVAVAETLSFRKAAERCHVSQPSLSAQVSALEEALGATLFERDTKHVLVTAGGREILERARALIQGADGLVEAAQRASDPFASTLRIGAIPTISPYLLPSVAPALRAAHPALTVMWLEEKTDALVKSLSSGALDAAIVALEAEIGDVEREVLARDPFVLAAPTSSPLGAEEGPVDAAELEHASVLLLDDGHCFRDQALAVCASAQADELGFRATSLSTLAQMVASGAGVTLLPYLSIATEAKRADLRIRPFLAPEPGRTIALVWRKTSPLGAALREIASTLRDAYPKAGEHARAEQRRRSRQKTA
jgi:LysR family transcriptional regulator, hydrogen peroxide-inducible genes activator